MESAGPSAPNVRLNLLIGLLAGVLCAAGVLLLSETLSTRVDSEEKAVAITGVPSLGTIRRRRGATPGLAMTGDTRSSSAEDFRQLRANLGFVAVDVASPVFVVTSSVLGEGKTTVAINVAIALSEGGKRVLVIDADLRRPGVAGYTGLIPSIGLSTVLAGRVSLPEAVQPWGDNGALTVLTAGRIPPNPSELLASRAMTSLIAMARSMFDVIVIDTPPLGVAADAAVLVPEADGTVVIVDRTAVRRNQLAHTVEAICRAGGAVAGVVINRARGKRTRDTRYYCFSDAEQGGEAGVSEPSFVTERGSRLLSPTQPKAMAGE